ncbi:MAG: YCF48-related protein [Cycloclasticus sp.]|nr:YCF48-related protein [Cycloclasticus sp.]
MGFRALLGILAYLTLVACEAPLVLDGVEDAKKEPIHRTDRIQAAASLDDEVLLAGIGFILNSSDGAETWKREQPADMPSFIGAAICPNGIQAAVSAEKQVWVSSDKGGTWQANNLGTEEAPQFLSCGPDNKLWVAASFSTLLSSADQGETWQQTTFDEDLIFTYVKFFDERHGIIVGEFGSVYTTEDGGENWLPKEEPIPNDFFPLAVVFLNSESGWVGGSSGVIFHTADGGNTWAKEETGTVAPIYGLSASKLGVYAVGDFGTFLERDMVNNSVAKWSRSTAVSARFYLRAIATLGDNKLVLGGGAGTLQSLIDDGSGRLVAANTKEGE